MKQWLMPLRKSRIEYYDYLIISTYLDSWFSM